MGKLTSIWKFDEEGEEKNRIKQNKLKFTITKFVSFDPKKLIYKIEDDFDGGAFV